VGWGLRATCGQRVTDMIKTKVYELKLGARYIWQVMHGETLREHFNEVLSSVFEVLVGIPAVLGVPGCRCLCNLEGLAGKVKLVTWRSDMALSKLILIRNRLEMHDIQSGIKLS